MTTSKTLATALFLVPVFLGLGACSGDHTAAAPPSGDDAGADVGAPSSTSFDFSQYVDPFIGTAGSGAVTPSATVPFGMVQFGAETSGNTYQRSSSSIHGFSLTHFSGAGCPNGGDFPIMPTGRPITSGEITGAFELQLDGVPPTYTVPTDEASPGFYRAYSLRSPNEDSSHIYEVQLTATTRSGFGTFIFPSTSNANALAFNVGRNAGHVTNASVAVDAANGVVSGWVESGDFCDPDPNRYKAYFSARFDQPVVSFGTWDSADAGTTYTVSEGSPSVTSPFGGAFVRFNAGTVHVKVGFSYVSTANADLNLTTETPSGTDWVSQFTTVKGQARQAWNDTLAAVNVNTTAPGASKVDLTKFYTALYHTMLYPNVFSDVNGQYPGDELGGAVVHTDTTRTHYANFSNWDIHRGEIQLLALLRPQTSDTIQSMVDFANQGTALPHWGYANDESNIMNGDPAAMVIANAYAFGATNFDTAGAIKFLRTAADDPSAETRHGQPVRDKLTQYQSGYVQGTGDIWAWSGLCTLNAAGTDCDDQAGNPPGSGFQPGAGRGYSGSETLEYAVSDFALGMFMRATGQAQDQYQPYLDRSSNWQQIFSGDDGVPYPRNADGTWVAPMPHPRNADGTWVAPCARPLTQIGCFDPKRGNGFDEGTPTQYRWYVPQDLPGLIAKLGGPAAAKPMLDAMLSVMKKGAEMSDLFLWGTKQ